MEPLRCGEALLRSSQPLLSFLAPTAHRSTTAVSPIARHCRTQRSQWHPSRSFTTTQSRCQQSAAAAQNDSPSPSRNYPTTTPSSQGGYDDISSLLDSSLDLNQSAPTMPAGRTSRFHSRDAQSRNASSSALASEYAKAASQTNNSVDEILKGLTTNAPRNKSTVKPSTSISPDLINSAFSPGNYESAGHLPPEVESAPMKLGPTVGRTVNVNAARGMDVGRSFRQLEVLCARNQVRKDSMRQRFHERPGLKRKRLKSERWRKNFRENFKGIVSLVQKMRKQGW